MLSGCELDLGGYPQTQSLESAVQATLAEQGYYQGPIDGSLGLATRRAICNYQSDHRLTPTGTINPALTASMGLGVQGQGFSPGCSPSYATYPAAVVGSSLWGGSGYWNRCWQDGGGYQGRGGFNGWGYGNNQQWNQGGNGHNKNHNDHDGDDDHKKHDDDDHKNHHHKKHGKKD